MLVGNKGWSHYKRQWQPTHIAIIGRSGRGKEETIGMEETMVRRFQKVDWAELKQFQTKAQDRTAYRSAVKQGAEDTI